MVGIGPATRLYMLVVGRRTPDQGRIEIMAVMDKYGFLREQVKRDKLAGRSNNVFGEVFHVLPGTSATHLNWARKHRRNVDATFDEAYARVISGRGDVIVLWPGAHTPTAAVTIAKNGVQIFGPEAWFGEECQKPSAIFTPPAASDGFTVTGTDVGFRGITIVPITQKVGITFSAAALRLKVTKCHFDMNVAVAHTSTKGIIATGAAVDAFIKGNTFYSLGAHGPFITVTGLLNYAIKENDFIVLTGGTMASGILVGAAAQGLIQKNNFFGGTLTAAIDGTGATVAGSCRIFDNNFGVLCTVPIDNFSATNLTDLKDNRLATIGGGTGGTLIAANT